MSLIERMNHDSHVLYWSGCNYWLYLSGERWQKIESWAQWRNNAAKGEE